MTIESLLAADAWTDVAALMDADPPVVTPGADRERAAWKAVWHGEGSLAVAGADGRFTGFVPPSRLLGILLAEHDGDMDHLSGYLHDVSSARLATELPLCRRFWHRLPWLLVGLAGAVVIAALVGSFETELERNVTLAFFVPGIVYLADAVGTQTETLLIRGLSLGVRVRDVAAREVATGLLLGVVLAPAFLPVGLIGWSSEIAVAVALALGAACGVASAVAMALPLVLQRFGTDPAYGSGPLATVIQDGLSLLIYFAIVRVVV